MQTGTDTGDGRSVAKALRVDVEQMVEEMRWPARSSTRSAMERATRRARFVAGAFQTVAYLMMLAAVWGVPVRAVMVASRVNAPSWSGLWSAWAVAEWSLACLAGSYLLWCVAEWLRDAWPRQA